MSTQRRSAVPWWLVPFALLILVLVLLTLAIVVWIALTITPSLLSKPAATLPQPLPTTERTLPPLSPPLSPTTAPAAPSVPATPSLPQPAPSDALPQFDFPVTWAQVDTILDGDTIRLSDGLRVRYIGVDTPETKNKPADCYAKEAAAKNRRLVEGVRVALRKDKSETDRYGRLLRYVYLVDGRMVNEILVKGGFARAATFRPDVQFADFFSELEQQAKRAKRGMWKKCEI